MAVDQDQAWRGRATVFAAIHRRRWRGDLHLQRGREAECSVALQSCARLPSAGDSVRATKCLRRFSRTGVTRVAPASRLLCDASCVASGGRQLANEPISTSGGVPRDAEHGRRGRPRYPIHAVRLLEQSWRLGCEIVMRLPQGNKFAQLWRATLRDACASRLPVFASRSPSLSRFRFFNGFALA